VKKVDIDSLAQPGITSDQHQRTKKLEREVFELKRANEKLHKAAAFFAQAELDSATAPALLYYRPSLDIRKPR